MHKPAARPGPQQEEEPCRLSLLPFNCAEAGGRTLVSNCLGGWSLLRPAELRKLRNGAFARDRVLLKKLEAGGFVPGRLDEGRAVRELADLSGARAVGPSLHILVVTLRCDHACVYCRAVKGGEFRGAMMSRRVARKSVDMAFASPGPDIAIEFQGGEALLNWPVVKDAVLYARRVNKTAGKDLSISIVTNLSLMDEEKFAFLRGHGVGICTSLDGPEFLHNASRRHFGGSSHAKAVRWLKRALGAAVPGKADSLPSALMTTTRQSLKYPREIVETYRGLGLGGIFLRPLSPIGYARSVWGEIGYSPAEFGDFYAQALAQVLKINAGGERFVERNAAIIASKALLKKDPNYLDLRSPCGAGVGQLAYNWDGGVYTCDEGRMAGSGQDDSFRLGSVLRNTYAEIISAPAVRACAMASCLEAQPYCSRCAFKPFCGVCPVHNYETQGSPWGNIVSGGWCGVQKGIMGAVFSALGNPRSRKIIEGWLEK